MFSNFFEQKCKRHDAVDKLSESEREHNVAERASTPAWLKGRAAERRAVEIEVVQYEQKILQGWRSSNGVTRVFNEVSDLTYV